MRILQLIDSLEAGGAERMALNYANLLSQSGFTSYLVTTRKEGALKGHLIKKVNYLFLNKKSTFDLFALKKLRNYINYHSIDLIHAHGESWFFAVLCRIFNKNLKILWHDHYGNSRFLENRTIMPLKFFSKNFNGIICVNDDLKKWSLENLNCKNVQVLKNFIDIPRVDKKVANYVIQLVCLANFREQKDHLTLFSSCDIASSKIKFHLHLIGKDFPTPYSDRILYEIENRTYITYHGEVYDPQSILREMDIGILSSQSEGLPLSILEYGAAKLAVISTDVGAVKSIIGETGVLVSPGDYKNLAEAIISLVEKSDLRHKMALDLQNKIYDEFSKEKVIHSYIKFIEKIC